MTFTEFRILKEAKFFKLDNDTINQIHNIVDNFVNNPKKRDVKHNQRIGNITTTNLENDTKISIPIVISKKINKKIGGIYNPNTKQIELNYDFIITLKADALFEILSHETVHAIQRYKKQSEKYKNAVSELEKGKSITDLKNPEHYYKEPLELEAQLTGMMYKIKEVYKSLKRRNLEIFKSESAWKNDKERFLTKLRIFINAPYSTYDKYNELELPSYMNEFKPLLNILHKDNRLWKRFKVKLMDLYNEIEENN